MSNLDPDPGAPPVGGRAAEHLVTIERFLADHQPPDATGSLSRLLDDIALAGKLIASQTRRAGLTELLGKSGAVNVQGEEQKLMDMYADDAIRAAGPSVKTHSATLSFSSRMGPFK